MSPEIPLFFGCVVLSGFFSGSETAFLSANRLRLRAMAKQGDKAAARVLAQVEDPRRLLAGILVGNNIVNVLAASSATAYCVDRWGVARGVIAATAVSTVILVIFSEYLPKTFAARHPIRFATRMVAPLRAAILLMSPFVRPLEALTRPLGKLLRGEEDSVDFADLRIAVSEGVSKGTLDENVARLLRGGLTFQWKKAQDILIPRVDVRGVSADASYTACVDAFKREGLSRLLVMEGDDPDSDIGYLALKDLHGVKHEAREAWTARDSVRDSVRVPESLAVVNLLAEMRESGVHFAVVKDEHGGTEGIVTLEDILEELVGEIRDEHDREERPPVVERSPGVWLVRGDVNVKELADQLELNIPSEDAHTIGGLVGEDLGRLPRQGDVIELEEVRIKALRVRGRRVLNVMVEKLVSDEE
ncbi:MAG: hemolysin family protein [Planctomycetota bacterium]